MTNKYPANCFYCKRKIKQGSGYLQRMYGSWYTQCFECHDIRKNITPIRTLVLINGMYQEVR